MTRNERIQAAFDKSMRLIEIGPSYNPIVPKRDGWQTTIVDHASKAELIEKYGASDFGDPAEMIEDVDIVWTEGPLSNAFPEGQEGTYDGLIASHVVEHMPDLIGFLHAADRLLKPGGILFIALPDKRLCFDFFHPSSTTGDVLDGRGRSRHSAGTLFDHATLYAIRGDDHAWSFDRPYAPFRLAHDLIDAKDTLAYDESGPYRDAHCWHFTPASFELVMLELNLLRRINWAVQKIEPIGLVEFFAWMERREIFLPLPEVAQRRLGLLEETIRETKQQVALMEPPAPVTGKEPLTISAVIPLYNGQRFIRQSLTSILAQTYPPKEIIVVDDGSSDDGGAVVEEIAKTATIPITLLRKDNGGQSSARNFGVDHSTGQLIALLDQDDLWYPHHLEELVKPFEKPEVGRQLGWVYSDLDEMDTELNMINHQFLRTLPTPHPKRTLFVCLRENMFVLPSASLISREAFQRVGGFDVQLSGYEDDDLFMRLFRAGYANVFLEEALSIWRIYPESSSYTFRMRRSRNIYFRKLMDMFEDDPARARFIKRDLLVPRFYMEALAEYMKAVRTNDRQAINETRAELQYVVSFMPGWKRKLFGQALAQLDSPKIADVAYSMRRYLRPIARRLI